MSNLLHNMSAPPRSVVVFHQNQLNKYMAFNPIRLAKLINCRHIKNLVDEVREYIKSHPDIDKYIKKPTGYMIAEYINLDGCDKYDRKLNDKLSKYQYVECDDIELLIIVFGCTVGDLYIPNRKIIINETKLDKVLFFPIDEVNS